MSAAIPPATVAGKGYPAQPLRHLDSVWIQVAGTLCNLSCTHCFVSSGPGDDHHALMSRERVREVVSESLALGAKEFYFTGGEPFVHSEMLEILADTLALAPATVLTNGTLFTAQRLDALRSLSDRSRFALEIRVSLDGATASEHDAFRGAGTFERALGGLAALEAHGLLPIVTVTHGTDEDAHAFRARYLGLLRDAGLARPRLKVLPMFLLGREAQRTRGYEPGESLADLPSEAFDETRLQCGSCRAITSRGVFVCPLLVDEPIGRMGGSLSDSLRPFALRHGACFTCYATGMTCGTG
jgi:uncharacterized Fe-S cluster-containing radical SAM superfamily protein